MWKNTLNDQIVTEELTDHTWSPDNIRHQIKKWLRSEGDAGYVQRCIQESNWMYSEIVPKPANNSYYWLTKQSSGTRIVSHELQAGLLTILAKSIANNDTNTLGSKYCRYQYRYFCKKYWRYFCTDTFTDTFNETPLHENVLLLRHFR